MTIRPLLCRLLAGLLMLSAVPVFAVNRTITITAPATARPGDSVHVVVTAATDAADAEQIAFFHAEYSTDNGVTWNTRYAEKVGRSATRPVDFIAGPAGSTALVRVRIAYRGGKAGDIDYTGAPIVWGESWAKWGAPPAKQVAISVMAK